MKTIRNLVEVLTKKASSSSEDLGANIPKVFFCHVPKCAGSALSGMIQRQIYADRRVATFSINLEASQKASQVCSMPMARVREIVLAYNLSVPHNYFGTGHVYCRPNLVESHRTEWDFVTILRNPIDRWISEYVYNTYKNLNWARNTLTIDDYLSSAKGNLTGVSFLKYFSSIPGDYAGNVDEFVDEAVANLAQFSVVGTVENLENWCQTFKARFGKDASIPRTNTSPNIEASERIRSDESLMRRIEVLCEPDLCIYQRMVDLTGKPGDLSPCR